MFIPYQPAQHLPLLFVSITLLLGSVGRADDSAGVSADRSLPDLIHDVSRSIVLIRNGGTRVDFLRLPDGKFAPVGPAPLAKSEGVRESVNVTLAADATHSSE